MWRQTTRDQEGKAEYPVRDHRESPSTVEDGEGLVKQFSKSCI